MKDNTRDVLIRDIVRELTRNAPEVSGHPSAARLGEAALGAAETEATGRAVTAHAEACPLCLILSNVLVAGVNKAAENVYSFAKIGVFAHPVHIMHLSEN